MSFGVTQKLEHWLSCVSKTQSVNAVHLGQQEINSFLVPVMMAAH